MKEKEAPRPEWRHNGTRYTFEGPGVEKGEYTVVPILGYLEPVGSGFRVSFWNRSRGEYDTVEEPFPTKEAAQQFVEISYRLDSAEAP
jgi:hypothetical protein